MKNNLSGAADSLLSHRRKRRKTGYIIFVIVALSYPVLRFLVVWGYVNISAVISSFTRYDYFSDKNIFVGIFQYKTFIRKVIFDEGTRKMLLNSFMYFPVTCFISLPLSILFSYFLFKKIPGGAIFRVIFYLPSILPIAVLAMSFRFAFSPDGFIDPILKAIGVKPPLWLGSSTLTPIMIFVYCVWAGLGFNIVLFSGAMSRVPGEIAEYSRLEGVGFFRELIQIMVPLVWPTIVTTFILGMSSVLTVYLQPFFLMGSNSAPTYGRTISMDIFNNYSNEQQTPYLAAFGLTCTICFVPFIMLARWFMNRFFQEVAY